MYIHCTLKLYLILSLIIWKLDSIDKIKYNFSNNRFNSYTNTQENLPYCVHYRRKWSLTQRFIKSTWVGSMQTHIMYVHRHWVKIKRETDNNKFIIWLNSKPLNHRRRALQHDILCAPGLHVKTTWAHRAHTTTHNLLKWLHSTSSLLNNLFITKSNMWTMLKNKHLDSE